MKGWLGLACVVGWTATAGVALAAPADDPLQGIELGMSKPALPALLDGAGATPVCQQVSAEVNSRTVRVERCTADVLVDGQRLLGRVDALLAANAEGVSRVVAVMVEGAAVDAAAAREQLVARWGEPVRVMDAEGAGATAHWQVGARRLVLVEACGAGVFCIAYSENSWARQAARAAGMSLAMP